MMNHITELKPVATEEDRDIANHLRELADMMDEGKVSEIVVVANVRSDGEYMRVAKFECAWKALGALEYAKMTVHKGME